MRRMATGWVALLLLAAGGAAAQFTPGGVAVLRVDSREFGTTGNFAVRGFVDQFDGAAANQTAASYSVALPTQTAGGVNRVLFAGTQTAAQLTRSADGLSLVAAGYDVNLQTGTPASTTANKVSPPSRRPAR